MEINRLFPGGSDIPPTLLVDQPDKTATAMHAAVDFPFGFVYRLQVLDVTIPDGDGQFTILSQLLDKYLGD